MKKIVTILALIISSNAVFADFGFYAGLGIDMPQYRAVYLEPNLSISTGIATDVDFKFGAGLGLFVVDQKPDFILPFDIGVAFLLPKLDFGLAPELQVGLKPLIGWGERTSPFFYVGPYLGLGFRWKLQPAMGWYAKVEQALYIGAPEWLSTGTKVEIGIVFTPDGSK